MLRRVSLIERSWWRTSLLRMNVAHRGTMVMVMMMIVVMWRWRALRIRWPIHHGRWHHCSVRIDHNRHRSSSRTHHHGRLVIIAHGRNTSVWSHHSSRSNHTPRSRMQGHNSRWCLTSHTTSPSSWSLSCPRPFHSLSSNWSLILPHEHCSDRKSVRVTWMIRSGKWVAYHAININRWI